MRLLRDGAVAHRAGLEAAHDRLDRLDLVDRDRLHPGHEVHEAAQRAEVLRLLVDERRVLLEERVAPGAAGVLELVDRLRVEEVVLAGRAVLVLAAGGQARVDDRPLRREAALVAEPRLLRDDVDPDAADARRRPGEVLVDEVLVQADRLEHLGAVVALDRRDPHLGDHLHDPLVHGLHVLLLGVLRRAGDEPEAHLVVDGLEREVRVHRRRAVADEQREVVDLARLARLERRGRCGCGCPRG